MKKVLAALLSILLTVTLMMGAVLPASAATVAGDVNGDGRADTLDALIALRVISGQTYTGKLESRGLFVNGDALADTADLVLLLRNASSDWEVELTAPDDADTVAKQELTGFYYIKNLAVRIISQNLLHSTGSGAPASRSNANRIVRMTNLMEAYDPDICGLQEYRWTHWYTAFEENIFPITGEDPAYEAYIACRVDLSLNEIEGAGTSAETPLYTEEKSAIFWKNDRFDLCVDAEGNEIKGQFWFSETPDKPSPYFGASELVAENGVYTDGRQRQCIWVKLHDNYTGEEFYYYNVHGPNADDTEDAVKLSLIPAMQLLDARVKTYLEKYGDAPVVVGGDFNMNYCLACDLPAYSVLTESGYDDMAAVFNNYQGTFPRFGKNVTEEGVVTARVDFHFNYDDSATPISYKVLEEVFDENNEILVTDLPFGGYNATAETDYDYFYGYWASDHLGICSEFIF